MVNERLEVVIIGGGQAGLAIGYYLAQQGRDFIILDAGPEIGHSWRERYDSLVLFTPAWYSALPGLPFPGSPDHHPTKDEVAAYLGQYAETFGLPVCLNTRVCTVRQSNSGYEVVTDKATYQAEQVVVATGPFQQPYIPPLAGSLDPSVFQVHSAFYRNPAQLPPGPALVVGAGNSGAQITAELAESRKVYLSVGKRPTYLPQRLLGKDIFWWFARLGLSKFPLHSRLGQLLHRMEPVIGTNLTQLVREKDVELVGRATQAEGHTITFAGGRTLRVTSVIWATGYQFDYDWVDVPVFDEAGTPIHQRGVTAAGGFYFLGLPWLYRWDSAVLGGVGRDAAFLAQEIERHANEKRAQESGAHGVDGPRKSNIVHHDE